MDELNRLLVNGCFEGQGFGGNYNPSYAKIGLLGHPAIDVTCGYSTDIHSMVSGKVPYLFTPEKPASDGYTAIYILVDTPLECFEFSYGHVSEIRVATGDMVAKDAIIGQEGNKGTVYSGNRLITLAEQAAGSHEGTHRHIQKRVVLKVKRTSAMKHYLSGPNGIYFSNDIDGPTYYEVYDYENGYNGCVDWTQPLFNRDLYFGLKGYDVLLLQRALNVLGAGVFAPTGFFGIKTLASVQALQRSNQISPTLGYVGSKTRAFLNNKFSQLS